MQQSRSASITVPDLASIQETCVCLGLSKASVWRMLKRGDICAIKLGHRTMVEGATIRAYIDAAPKAHYRQ